MGIMTGMGLVFTFARVGWRNIMQVRMLRFVDKFEQLVRFDHQHKLHYFFYVSWLQPYHSKTKHTMVYFLNMQVISDPPAKI